jgi:predicted dehydrogenase
LDVKPLITHRFPLEDAPKAYDLIMGEEFSLGILLEYGGVGKGEQELRRSLIPLKATLDSTSKASSGGVSFIGAGNYASAVLIPAFHKAGARLETLVSNTGVGSVHHGRKFGFAKAASDAESVFSDPGTDVVVVTTRHDSHAGYVIRALESDRHVFVEKPLCLTLNEWEAVRNAMESRPGRHVMVGFNRRFAPHVRKMRGYLTGMNIPKSFVVTVNAGSIPTDHWTQDLQKGGGRILGEACHFIDLLRHLAGSPIRSFKAARMDALTRDTASILLEFEDGSLGNIHYLANGSKSFPKERVEVFAAGGILQIDNFRVMRSFGWKGVGDMRLWRQDKGQAACAAAFMDAVRNGAPSPISRAELLEVARVTIEVAQAMQ